VTVKDMRSGTQTQVPRAEAAHWLALAIRGDEQN
jgi:hypothetical protein